MHSITAVHPNLVIFRRHQTRKHHRRSVVTVSNRNSSGAEPKKSQWNAVNTIGALSGAIAILLSMSACCQQFSDVKAGLELVGMELREMNAKLDKIDRLLDGSIQESIEFGRFGIALKFDREK